MTFGRGQSCQDLRLRLFERAGFRRFSSSDFHEMPAEAAADESGLVGLHRKQRGGEINRQDLRDDTRTERSHLIQWQAGQGGYPIVVRWDRNAMPPATSRGSSILVLSAKDNNEWNSRQCPALMAS